MGEARVLAALATIELFAEDGTTRLVWTEQGAFFGGDDTEMFARHLDNVLASLGRELMP